MQIAFDLGNFVVKMMFGLELFRLKADISSKLASRDC